MSNVSVHVVCVWGLTLTAQCQFDMHSLVFSVEFFCSRTPIWVEPPMLISIRKIKPLERKNVFLGVGGGGNPNPNSLPKTTFRTSSRNRWTSLQELTFNFYEFEISLKCKVWRENSSNLIACFISQKMLFWNNHSMRATTRERCALCTMDRFSTYTSLFFSCHI